jgi:type III secretion protein V
MIRIHAALARLRGAGEALFAVAVLAIVALLVAPLPPAALDACIALNLAVAATILVVTLFSPDALRFASFPTLLLLTTLYRVALNVGSTRLILSRGEGGRVIAAFGRVVVQGNYVVGAVVFAILTLVQLLVVAKGAERVAEVAARFTLDALPGKQMAIDADVRAGLLDQAQARQRRRALERESQLYGAMDGALKFVKGDAIAGIAIVLVNVVGGLVAGALRGMDPGAAARRYALLAIGDGLVSQIPALLVAVAAGVAVTRVAAEREGDALAGEIGRQLLSDPRALAAVSALLGGLAVAPGLPATPFGVLSAAAGAAAWWRSRPRPAAMQAPESRASGSGGEDPWAPASPISVELGSDLLEEAHRDGRLERELLPALRDRLWHDLGVRVPAIEVREGPEAGAWTLLVDEVPVARGHAPAADALALVPPDELALVAIPARPIVDVGTGRAAAIIAGSDRPRAEALGPVRGALERALADLESTLGRHAAAFLGIQETQLLLDALEPSAPALVREVSRQVPAAVLAEVLRRLVEEGVSIRPLRTILDAILEAGGAARGAAALAEACRRALRRHIAHRCAGDGPLPALLLEPSAEAAVRDALLGPDGSALEPADATALLDALGAALDEAAERPVVLASPDIRRAVHSLVAPTFPRLQVLSCAELPPETPIRLVGRIGLSARAAA